MTTLRSALERYLIMRRGFLHSHLALKEAALAKLAPYEPAKPVRFRADDRLLAFLEAL